MGDVPVQEGKRAGVRCQKVKAAWDWADEMGRVVRRYLEGLEKDGWRKPQNGGTFFNSGYVDYLDCNYGDAQPNRISGIPGNGKPEPEQSLGDGLVEDGEEWWKYGPNSLGG